jgi:heme exporter protein D
MDYDEIWQECFATGGYTNLAVMLCYWRLHKFGSNVLLLEATQIWQECFAIGGYTILA